MPASIQMPDALGSSVLSFALVGPEDHCRSAVASALAGCQGGPIREFASYPSSLDDLPGMQARSYDVVIVDLDSNTEKALDIVESICAKGLATVMAYSVHSDTELLMRCMRAGAREYLTLPLAPWEMEEALSRISGLRPAARQGRESCGRMLVFLGAKGGCGVTTLACGFAVAMAQESGQSTLLLDLDLPLGDAALDLGIIPQYSTVDALQDFSRLDSNFLASLLFRHRSGLQVLAAPGRFPQARVCNEGIDRLLAVARQEFDNVVVDAGSRLDLQSTALFDEASTVYLVTQAGLSELRNANRLISEFFPACASKLEIVINRYTPHSLGVDDAHITRALTRPARWRVPADAAAVRRMQTATTPDAAQKSAVSQVVRLMARTACGLGPAETKKKRFHLFH
jgi:pilus assembly protein CpaE